jgi:hypothetical protein
MMANIRHNKRVKMSWGSPLRCDYDEQVFGVSRTRDP